MTSRISHSAPSPVGKRRRWLLGLEPVFEGGWLHKGNRARQWDVENEVVALALFGDVTIDLSQTKSAPTEVAISAWAILRDVDVIVPQGTHVELSGGGFRGRLVNEVPDVSAESRDRVVRIRGHTLLCDVTVRVAGGDT
jgi:predicted membrane protein